MSKHLDLAPISSQPSSRLKLATGYFTLLGGLTLGALGLLLVAGPSLRLPAAIGGLIVHPLTTAAWAATGFGLLWTGRELRHRRIAGWYSALTTAVMPLIPSIFGRPMSSGALLVSCVGIMILLSVRDELK
jgi:hypothetical protein